MRNKLFIIAAAAAGSTTMFGGASQAAINYAGGTYSENFNDLPSTTTTTPFTATIGDQQPIPGETAYVGTKTAGTGTTAMPFVVSNASTSGLSGGIYSLGTTGSAERALGSVASGSNVPAYGLEIVNTSGSVITTFSLTFSSEEYRSASGTAGPNVVAFAYGTSAVATSTNFLTDPDLTNEPTGNLVSTAAEPAVVSDPPITTPRAVAVTGLNVQPNESLFIRWTDPNEVGNDAAIGIDDLSFTTNVVPEPSALGLIGIASLVALRRRRNAAR